MPFVLFVAKILPMQNPGLILLKKPFTLEKHILQTSRHQTSGSDKISEVSMMLLRGKFLVLALLVSMLAALVATAQSGRTTPRPRP
ncbi:MAG TPA: hypothetical protein PLR59_08975, partial [Brevundimonas sp.]|nr:hypothetical protein [Brevundimonas sp.]